MINREFKRNIIHEKNRSLRSFSRTRRSYADSPLKEEVEKLINCTIGDYTTQPMYRVKICENIYSIINKYHRDEALGAIVEDLNIEGYDYYKVQIRPKKFLKRGVALGMEVANYGDQLGVDSLSVIVLNNGDFLYERGDIEDYFAKFVKPIKSAFSND